MAKAKTVFVCSDCGTDHTKWQGQCASCGAWNSLSRYTPGAVTSGGSRAVGYSGEGAAVKRLAEVDLEDTRRIATGFSEFDRVLGGGLVPGSVVLIGGEPGAGKSTLLLQVSTALADTSCLQQGVQGGVLYVSGEESLQQLALRARRLGLSIDRLNVAAETRAEEVAGMLGKYQPNVLILDSIQVMHLDGVESVPGSVTQVRECAAYFTRIAKQSKTVVIMVGHVTKEGSLAGPKVLEHMIDCFIMLDCPAGSRFRTLRGQKNRFGAVNELGVFAMTDTGMKEVSNPSAIFLQKGNREAAGSVTTVIWEGTRPLLVEIQALVDQLQGGNPRRVAVGLDSQRLAMHLAVLHRHGGVGLSDQDVFANVVGGVKITETAADLALILAVVSSSRNRVLPQDLIVFGELGLTGEVRPVANGQERLREAQKHGFKRAVVPSANRPKQDIPGLQVKTVETLNQALDVFSE